MYREWLVRQPRWVAGLVVLVCALAAGLLGPIAIEVEGEAPMTAQTLLILLPALLFGWEVGLVASALYLIAGGMGAPVFAHFTSGWSRFTGTTGGYLLAFPMAALLVGWWAPAGERFRFLRSGLLLFAGQILIVALGMAWQRNIVPLDGGVWSAVEPLLPGLVMKTAVGTLILTGIARVVDRARRN
jgi:biotin transport system substrate-specific component